MTAEEIGTLKALFSSLSLYYRQPLGDSVILMYSQDLADLNYEQVLLAIKKIKLNPSQKFVPYPSEIRALIEPVEQRLDFAKEAAAKIVSAVSMFGYCNAHQAKDYIGDLGWRVVQLQGGWNSICEVLTANNLAHLQAQWRDLADTVHRNPTRSDLLLLKNEQEKFSIDGEREKQLVQKCFKKME